MCPESSGHFETKYLLYPVFCSDFCKQGLLVGTEIRHFFLFFLKKVIGRNQSIHSVSKAFASQPGGPRLGSPAPTEKMAAGVHICNPHTWKVEAGGSGIQTASATEQP